MKHFAKKIFIALLLTTYLSSLVNAYAPTNFHRPYDVDFRAHEWGESNFRLGAFLEYGETDSGRNWGQDKSNVLQLYNATESSVGMLLGAPRGSAIYRLANSLGVSAATITDDSCRGRFCVTGEYEETSAVFFAKYKLPISLEGTFDLSLFVPVKSFKFSNVRWVDLTRSALSADLQFKEQISSQLEAKARMLGCLDINTCDFSQSGIGDIALMFGWHTTFKQEKDYLKKVGVRTKVGVSMPTGEKKDPDQSLTLPLGNDGCWGIPASLGLDLDFIYDLRAGIELGFLGMFDRTHTYRMKTSRHQTDYLLLHKGEATMSQGATWKFTLFAQAKKIFEGFSAMVSYHFVKHDDDRLTPESYNFDYNIVNTAERLKEWSTHSFMFQADYAFKVSDKIRPAIGLFYKLPIAGQRAILAHTFGAQMGVNF